MLLGEGKTEWISVDNVKIEDERSKYQKSENNTYHNMKTNKLEMEVHSEISINHIEQLRGLKTPRKIVKMSN